MAELTPQEADYEIEHFNQTKQPLYYGLIITFFSISFIMVCLRLLSRKIQKADLALDDYFSVAGMVRLLDCVCQTMLTIDRYSLSSSLLHCSEVGKRKSATFIKDVNLVNRDVQWDGKAHPRN